MKKIDWKKFFSAHPQVVLVYQYGSSAKRDPKNAKDIDIALLLKEGLAPATRLEIQLDIADQLEKLFGKSVDLTLLNQASPFLAHQVIKYGRLLYGSAKLARDFVVKTLTHYFEASHFQQFFLERMEKRLGVKPHGR